MPTVISHAVVGAALMSAFPPGKVPRRLIWWGATCSMVPDLDVIGFLFGIHYGDLLGHRGLTHSILFAVCLSTLAWLATRGGLSPPGSRFLVWLYLFLATVSHGILDAFTNGGLGVAFFSPFDTSRYFFPFTPIQVSPIGAHFFSGRGVAVLVSELKWVWVPFITFAVVAYGMRRSPNGRSIE